MLRAEELLAGSEMTYEVEIPPEVLNPGEGRPSSGPHQVRLRPLRVSDLQRLTRAARDKDQLLATLMVQQALIEPELSVAQVAAMHVGLLQFLVDRVNQISGTAVNQQEMAEHMESPLARAAHILAREYGWTPQQVNDLTLGQVLLHLQMLKEARS
jgi:hypothetical protein